MEEDFNLRPNLVFENERLISLRFKLVQSPQLDSGVHRTYPLALDESLSELTLQAQTVTLELLRK
jgi:hypothetical protein